MLDSVVDIFIIAESNVSASGDAKPLYFFEAFKGDIFFLKHESDISGQSLTVHPQCISPILAH